MLGSRQEIIRDKMVRAFKAEVATRELDVDMTIVDFWDTSSAEEVIDDMDSFLARDLGSEIDQVREKILQVEQHAFETKEKFEASQKNFTEGEQLYAVVMSQFHFLPYTSNAIKANDLVLEDSVELVLAKINDVESYNKYTQAVFHQLENLNDDLNQLCVLADMQYVLEQCKSAVIASEDSDCKADAAEMSVPPSDDEGDDLELHLPPYDPIESASLLLSDGEYEQLKRLALNPTPVSVEEDERIGLHNFEDEKGNISVYGAFQKSSRSLWNQPSRLTPLASPVLSESDESDQVLFLIKPH